MGLDLSVEDRRGDWQMVSPCASEGEITVVVSLNYCNIHEGYVCTTSTYAFTTFIHNNKRRLARYHAM
jgi:hypothetical protein